MSDTSDGMQTEVLDLTNAKSVRLPGSQEPVPVDQLIPKAVYTQLTQRDAQNRQEWMAANQPALDLFSTFTDDPIGFYTELGSRLGLSAAQVEEGLQEEGPGGISANDPRVRQAIQQMVQPLAAEVDALRKFSFNKAARDSIAAEISALRAEDPTLTEADIKTIMHTAMQHESKSLAPAYRIWDRDRQVAKNKTLADELTATRMKQEYPFLGGASERNIGQDKGKRSLQTIIDENARKLNMLPPEK